MTPEQIQTAATMKAQGESLRTIGAVIGVSHEATRQLLRKDELQQQIKQAQTYLINECLMTAVQSQATKIKASQTITNKILNEEKLTDGAVKLLELGHDAEKQMLQATGIHPSHTQSIQINNILVDNRQELSPAIESLLAKHLQVDSIAKQGIELDDQVIDITTNDNKV